MRDGWQNITGTARFVPSDGRVRVAVKGVVDVTGKKDRVRYFPTFDGQFIAMSDGMVVSFPFQEVAFVWAQKFWEGIEKKEVR